MAWNPQSYFPMGYQQYQPQMQSPQMQVPQMMTPPTIRAEIVQVDNEQAAANYPVGAGASQMMIARDDSAIFVKTATPNGQYTLDVFQKRAPAPTQPQFDATAYVTREEFEARLAALNAPRKERDDEPV